MNITELLTICTGYICYDDGCHLARFSKRPARCSVSTESKLIADKDIVIDKMHMRGHVDSWCKEHCDPHKKQDLINVTSYHILIIHMYNDTLLL